ncbi:hypothetical protein BJX96DRAFT_93431 [Aspergillus floccosus]
MSLASGVSIDDECLTAFNSFRMSGDNKGDKTKFIIFKISDDKKRVVLDEASNEKDYEAFRSKLEAARDAKGNPAPRYAVYDVEWDSGEGQRYDFPHQFRRQSDEGRMFADSLI